MDAISNRPQDAQLAGDPTELDALTRAEHGDPFALLGCHKIAGGWVLRSFAPGAETATLLVEGAAPLPMTRVHDAGIFAVAMPARPGLYRIEAANAGGTWRYTDAYQFGPILGALDEHLIAEGAHMRLWRTLGAHPCTHEGADGTRFAVWAPGARRVSVVGDFNDWDGRRHAMRRRGSTGVWEIFVPDLGAGARYKYEVAPGDGGLPQPKSDPVGFQAELRPANASIVARLDGHRWGDADWMRERGLKQRTTSPISIYEVHLGSWKHDAEGQWLSYRALAEELVPYAAEMGFTHIELLPVSEHPFDGSWGYQPVGLFAPTSRFGTLDDFRAFVEACHKAEIGLILDWVPAHFPVDDHGLGRFDGSALYEHQDPREGYHPDWNTLIYNFGRTEVNNFLTANALYWTTEHHIDGLRVDAVASMLYRDYSREDGQWIPNRYGGRENLEAIDLLRRVNSTVYGADPSAMIVAEESTAWPGVSRPVHEGGLGFGFKWNMGWMHDTLQYIERDPIHRQYHHGEMTFGLLYAFSENFILPISHDEVVHGKGAMYAKMPGDHWNKLANLRAYYSFMWGHPGKKLLFMGQEFAQKHEWNAESQLDWGQLGDPLHAGLRTMVRDLNTLYRATPALHRKDCDGAGFAWIDGGAEAQSVYAWLRKGMDEDAPALCVYNFSGSEYAGWRLGVPKPGRWREAFNSDAALYGGAGRGNMGGATAEPVESHGHAHSIVLTLPPLTGMIFLHEDA